MTNKKLIISATSIILAIWLVLSLFVLFVPKSEKSDSERRPLAQFPELTLEALKDGSFMDSFDEFAKDQFPLRDSLRQLKGIISKYLLGQSTDSNGMFEMDGHLSQHNMVFNESHFNKRMEVLNSIYNQFIKDKNANVFVSVIPDKNYYLSQEHNFPTVSYDTIFDNVKKDMSWGKYIDMTGALDLDCFYNTDTHWRQEKILPVAQLLSQTMGVAGPNANDFVVEKIDKPFYGVWYGKAGLPVKPDDMYILNSSIFDDVKVTVDGRPSKIYDHNQLTTSDMYNIYMSGAKKGYVTIENPNAKTDKNLIIFRDSFGSSIAPLFVQDYKTVTLLDMRVLSRLSLNMVDFENADVLFMLSALVLNNTAEAFK